jgi:hypothetical protein
VKLSDIFKTISIKLSKPLSDIRYKSVSEENIKGLIEDIKWSLSSVDEAYSQLPEKQLNELYNRVTNKLRQDPASFKIIDRNVVNTILNYDKLLKGRARSMGFFKAMMFTSKALIQMLDQIQANIDVIVADKKGVMVGDIQISHGLLFGAVETANIVSLYNGYLLAIFSHVISNMVNNAVPKYMGEFVIKYSETYIELINQITNSSNGVPVISTIINLKKKGTDFRLADSTTVQHNLTADLAANGGIFVTILANVLNWTTHIAERYADYRHIYYENMKDRKKWLEQHVGNIRLILENMDPNDPEYVKTVKILAYYDDKIAELDKKINDYYSE